MNSASHTGKAAPVTASNASDLDARLAPGRVTGGGFVASALYRLLLLGRSPQGVLFDAPEIWPGDPVAGQRMLGGAFSHAGETHILTDATDVPHNASRDWLAWFHGHAWLKDISALGSGSEAPYFAREWLSAWMDANQTWSPLAWAPEVAAERVVNWCQHWRFLVRQDGSGPFEQLLRKTAGRDARHVLRTLPPAKSGFARLHAIKGQCFAAFALMGGEKRKDQTLDRLEKEIHAQILPDGGHVERSPERLTWVLQDLLELKAMLQVATGDVPSFLINAIDRVAPMVRALRHPDGGLALFNGGLQSNAAWLDLLLAQTASTAKPPYNAPYAGYQRLNAGNVHVILDSGKPTAYGRHQHGGALSFEMSVGKHRLIVNCGARSDETDPWRTALAATAAHSTLTVNDTSSAAFAIDGTLRRGPDTVTAKRQDVEEGALVEAEHDGYMAAFGVMHHRALFVASHGTDVRGEDRLIGTGGEHFTIRFHLHPSVKASLLGDGHGVLLRMPGKEVWRMRTSADMLSLEESVYVARTGDIRRCEQVVITGPLSGNGALVKWAITRDNG